MFAPFSLKFYLNFTVSIEIQGLSSIDCNFQGLLRTFKVCANYVNSNSAPKNVAGKSRTSLLSVI